MTLSITHTGSIWAQAGVHRKIMLVSAAAADVY